MIEDHTVLLTLLDILSLYLEKYTLLILHCCWCPALVKTSICQGLHKELQNDRSGCLSGWSPRKNGTDRKFMTLNYIKVTSVNIMSRELFILRGFFFKKKLYKHFFEYELSVMKNFSWCTVWSSKCSENILYSSPRNKENSNSRHCLPVKANDIQERCMKILSA